MKTFLLMELKFECPVCGETHTDDEYYWEGEEDDTGYLEETTPCTTYDCGEEMEVMEHKTIKTIIE